MTVHFRPYSPEPPFGEDYVKVRDFLIALDSHNYHFGRWDWMITHPYLEPAGLAGIGLWEDGCRLVALATYDCCLGNAYLLVLPGFEHLQEEMLAHAAVHLAKGGRLRVLIHESDLHLQAIASRAGYFPTKKKECDAILPIAGADLSFTLPDGFSITSLHDRYDLYQYGQVLWKGFNHEQNGEGPYTPTDQDLAAGQLSFERPNVNLDLKIAVVAPNGDFVSYCGMWQDQRSLSVLVEPVATDPAFRKMGLGKAAVLEAVSRCRDLGAQRAFVGSSQQFYYSIGFRPFATSTWWAKKDD
jgi:GNAT superfamily N-acetyltransferase